jgi:hypothetical protein
MKRIIAHILLTFALGLAVTTVLLTYKLIQQAQDNMIYVDLPRAVVFIAYLTLGLLGSWGFYAAYTDLMRSYRLTHYAEDRFE